MRKPRHIIPAATYHICARANRQELILEDEQIKLLFLDVLMRAKKKYGFIFRNFCLMGNHIHLEITPQKDTSISRIMQWILSVFALQYNRLHNFKGHVWYDRFKSKIITSTQQLINTFLYIANNPVRAALVNHPLEFAYSGITFHRQGPPWPVYKNLLDPLDNDILQEAINTHLAEYAKEKHFKHNETYSFKPKW
jgi:putative transposase